MSHGFEFDIKACIKISTKSNYQEKTRESTKRSKEVEFTKKKFRRLVTNEKMNFTQHVTRWLFTRSHRLSHGWSTWKRYYVWYCKLTLLLIRERKWKLLDSSRSIVEKFFQQQLLLDIDALPSSLIARFFD